MLVFICFLYLLGGNLVKKITGDFFIFSANNLKNGEVVYFDKNKNWVRNSKSAFVFSKEKLDYYEKFVSNDEKKCLIVWPYVVETTKSGQILKHREKIRAEGLKLSYKINV